MCNHENREGAMVVIDPGTPERHGRDGVWCDPCLEPIIRALNAGGVRTVASCCGHGTHNGSVALADGRWLHIVGDAEFRATDTRIARADALGTPEQEGEGLMGMFDSLYDGDDQEWQTKAFGNVLAQFEIGTIMPEPPHAPDLDSYQVEVLGVSGDEFVDSFATVRHRILVAVPDERVPSLPLVDYAGGLAAPTESEGTP